MKIFTTTALLLFVHTLNISAQTEIGLTLSGNRFFTKTTNPDDFGYEYRYVKPMEGSYRYSPAVGLHIKQRLTQSSFLDYQFVGFRKVWEICLNPYAPGTYPFFPDLYYRTRYTVLTHSLSFTKIFGNKIGVGLGGFLRFYFDNAQPIRDGYTDLEPSKQAGVVIKTSYALKKWHFELRYLKSVGDAMHIAHSPDFISMDSLELSVSYFFFKLFKKHKNGEKKKYN